MYLISVCQVEPSSAPTSTWPPPAAPRSWWQQTPRPLPSRAQTGGYSGAVGLAKDPSRFSVACRQIGTISFAKPLPKQEEVFKESASFVFKHVRVVRIVDAKRNTLVYLTYSDKLIDGSPDNAVTAVPVSGQSIPQK